MILRTKRAPKNSIKLFSEEMSGQEISMKCTYLQCNYAPTYLARIYRPDLNQWIENEREKHKKMWVRKTENVIKFLFLSL